MPVSIIFSILSLLAIPELLTWARVNAHKSNRWFVPRVITTAAVWFLALSALIWLGV